MFAQNAKNLKTYHSSVLGKPSLRSAMLLEVARAMVESALLELERGLLLLVELEFAIGLQLCNLSTGGIPAGNRAERFLKIILM